jgi:hypothetical protein
MYRKIKKSKGFRSYFLRFFLLARKLSIFYSIHIKSFMPIFDHRMSPEILSVEFRHTCIVVCFKRISSTCVNLIRAG